MATVAPMYGQTTAPDAKEWLYGHSKTTVTNYAAGGDVITKVKTSDLLNTRDNNGHITNDEKLDNEYAVYEDDERELISSLKTTHRYDAKSRVVDEAQYSMPDNTLMYHHSTIYRTMSADVVLDMATYYDETTNQIIRRDTEKRAYDENKRITLYSKQSTLYTDGNPSGVGDNYEYNVEYGYDGNISSLTHVSYSTDKSGAEKKETDTYTNMVWGGSSKGEPEQGTEDWFRWITNVSYDLSSYSGLKSYVLEHESTGEDATMSYCTVDVTKGEYDKYVFTSRSGDGKCNVIESVQTDKWGGFHSINSVYTGVKDDAQPTDANLEKKYVIEDNYTDRDNHEMRVDMWLKAGADAPAEIVLSLAYAESVERDAENDYVTKTVSKIYSFDDGEKMLESNTETVYDDYKQYPITTAISSATAGKDMSAPTRVYTLDGVYVGKSLDGLSKGMYIVKDGVKSRKVVK